MGYTIDFSTLSIDAYGDSLKKKTLIPSQKILQEGLEEKLAYFKSIGIKTVLELQKILKNKKKLSELAQASGLSEIYLTTLLREINGRQPKPRKLMDFVHIPKETIERLQQLGIKNTVHLYGKVLTDQSRRQLAQETGIAIEDILKLSRLTDLTRIQWVNTTFAWVLYQAGYDTVDKVATADYEELYKNIKRLNDERSLYKGNIGLNDMKICVEVAQEVKQEMVL